MGPVRRSGRALLGLTLPALGFFSLTAGTSLKLVLEDEEPADACHFGPYVYQLFAHNPQMFNGRVYHDGRVWYTTETEPCFNTMEVIGKRKVCGSFGCNYEDQASSGKKVVNSRDFWEATQQVCKEGTHRYLTVSNLQWPTFGGVETAVDISDGLEFFCQAPNPK